VIVSQSLAHQYFSGQDAVGKRIKTGLNFGNETPLRQIIGVVGDVRRDSLTDNPPPAIYMPDNQLPRGGTRFVVCSSLPPQALADTMREAVGSVDKKLPVYEMKTLDQYLGLATAQQRFNALVLGLFCDAGGRSCYDRGVHFLRSVRSGRIGNRAGVHERDLTTGPAS